MNENIYLNENTWNKFLHPQTNLTKEKVYVENPSDVPKNYSLLRGPKGGLYYDTTYQEREKFEFPDTKEKRQAIVNYNTEKQIMSDFLEGLRDTRRDGMSRLDQYVSYLDGKTYQLGKNIIETQSNLLNRAGINKNIIEKLTDETTDKLIYQEMRSWERQLGDHGIRHIEGNLRFFNQIFEKFKNEECRGALCQVSEKDKLLTYIVMINHDIGYTTEPSRTNIAGTKYHKEFSESWFEKERNIYEPILGKEDFERAKKYILLHDTPEIDWEKEPILSAISVSDNLALFYNEKLPTLFKKVPNALLLLFKMQEALQLKDNNKFLEYKNNLEKEIDATNYPEYTKYLLKRAAKEVSPYTPPVTLSMLTGEISSINYKKDSGLNVGIKYDKFEKEINKLYDQGQSKFIKLAESYGIKDFNKSKFDFIKNNKKLLSIFIENPDDIEKKLSIIRRKNKYCLVSDKTGTLNCDQNKSKLEAQHKAIIINEQDSNDIQKIDVSGIIIKGLIDKNSINKERRIFSGFGSVAVIDRQGDYLPIHEFKPVMEKLMARGAPVTDSHSNHVVGKIVDYTYKPTESGELGLYLTAEIYSHYPSDEETWHKIQDGEYTGFSLGGKAGTKTPTCNNIGCYNILGEIEAWEFSIVERPANQLANIDKVNKLAKASDIVDEVISSIIQKERVYIKTPAEAPRNTQVYTGERGGKYYETEELPKSEKEKVERQQRMPDIKVKSVKEIISPQIYNLYNDKFGQEIIQLLNAYGNIASGKSNDNEVNQTYNTIKQKLPNVYNYYKKIVEDAIRGDEGYNQIHEHQKVVDNLSKLQNQFDNATNRSDKIIAIDVFMYTSHTGGNNVVLQLWGKYHPLKTDIAAKYLEYLKTNIGKSYIVKEKVYIKTPAEAPRNTQVYTGERGGKYYETEELPKSEKEKVERQQRMPDIKVKSLEEVISPSNYKEMNIYDEGKELAILLEDYSKIASGKASDETIIKTYNFINKRIDNVLRMYENAVKSIQENLIYEEKRHTDFGYDVTRTVQRYKEDLNSHKLIAEKIKNLVDKLENAKTRQDMILGIDAFMNIAHTTGSSIILRLWRQSNLSANDVESAYKYLEYLKTNIGKSYIIKDGHIIKKPFAEYEDFDQCVLENKDKDDSNAYCGAIKHKVEKRADFTLEDVERIGDKLNVDWTKIDQNEFLIGLNIELEHGTKFPETNITDDDEIATAKIVLAHINEYPDYYSKTVGLPKLEDELKGIKKGRIYVHNESDAPEGVKIQTGKYGGRYYESKETPKQEGESKPSLPSNLFAGIDDSIVGKLKEVGAEYLGEEGGYEKIKINNIGIIVKSNDIPENLVYKVQKIGDLFKYYKLQNPPLVVFKGKTVIRAFSYQGANGKQYDSFIAGEADYEAEAINIYDDYEVEDMLGHEVGHFIHKDLFFRKSQEGNLIVDQYYNFPDDIKEFEHIRNIDNYYKMVNILQKHQIEQTPEAIQKIMDDIDYARQIGLQRDMDDNGLPFYDSGYEALYTVKERIKSGRPLSISQEDIKKVKMAMKRKKDGMDRSVLYQEWNKIWQIEPYKAIYAGRNENESFAQFYDDITRERRQLGTKYFYSYLDKLEVSNPKKLAFFKKYVFKNYMMQNMSGRTTL